MRLTSYINPSGREIFEAGHHVVDFFNSTHSLEQKVKAAPEHRRSDLEEFFALEELKQRQKELRDLILIAGRPGLLEDWDKSTNGSERYKSRQLNSVS